MRVTVCRVVMRMCGRMIMEGNRDLRRLVRCTCAMDEVSQRAPQGEHHGQQQQKQDPKSFQGGPSLAEAKRVIYLCVNGHPGSSTS